MTIPNSVTSIGTAAFVGCGGLTSVHISDIAAWCNICFNDNPLIYAHHLYLNGEEVSDLVIPSSVTSIGDQTFFNCSSLISVTIPNSVISIGNSAFKNCSGLTSVTIPNNVASIGESAFQDCSDLKSVTIPGSVTSIGDNAFANCTSIRYVKTFITEPYSISKNVFPNEVYRQSPLYIPAGTERLYSRFDGWREFLKIEEMDESEQPEIPGADKCATPTISYENGKLSFSCETEGVEFVSEIMSADFNKFHSKDVSLTGKYTVTVYATKEGYNNSDTATKVIDISGGTGSGVPGDVNGDGVVNAADVVKVTNIIMGAE